MANTPPKANDKPAQDDVTQALQDLYDRLGEAYWAATTAEVKDRIYGIEEIVYDLLMQLQKQQLDSNNPQYTQIQEQVKGVIGKIDKLKQDIDSIIHAVKVATSVAAAIDKAITLAGKYFGI